MGISKTQDYDAEHFLASKEGSSPFLDDILQGLEQGSDIHQSFTALFHQVADTYPNKTAIEFYQKTISYLELEQKSNQFAAFLTAGKVIEGSILAIALDRSIEMVVAMLGIVKAGCTYLPVDPKLPHERIQYMLEDAGARAIITSKSVLQEVKCTAEKLNIDTIFPILDEYSTSYVERIQDTSSLAYILYTSGSTGNPKGVKISHKNLTNLLLSVQKAPGMSPEDRLLAITTISFDIAGIELFLPLITGATIVMADSDAIKDGRSLLALLKEKEISFMQATPATWRMMVMAGWDKPLPVRILSGGEAFPKDLAIRLMELCEEVWNGYGPTETTIYSTMKRLDPSDTQITIGKPMANTDVYILDEAMNPVAEGEVGEIYISGEGVAKGYLGRPDLTAERFLPNNFDLDYPIIYKTGDLGCFLPSGEIVCKGRIDHQVKIRGFRIELGEIEQQLIKEPAIKEVAIHTWEDIPGNKRLVAYIVLEDASSTDEKKFSKFINLWKQNLKKSLPTYMIPVDWMPLEKLPLTANQKIDRKALPEPIPARPSFVNPKQQPATETEQLIHDIWCKSLRMSSISVEADFFELGGHSLLAVEVMTAVDQKTGKNVPLTTLFSHPTIRKFAAYLDQNSGDGAWASLVPIRSKGHLTPLYLVHGLAANAGTFYKLIDRLDEQQPIYGLQSKGLNGIDKPNETVQEMAAHYLQEILEQNPDGPYILGGYSFGGYVAFEMARMLTDMGKQVSKVLMFDTQAVNLPQKNHLSTGVLSRFNAQLAKRKVLFQVMLKAPKTYQKMKTRAVKRKKEKLLQKLGLAPAPPQDGRAAVIKKIREINHQAMVNYAPHSLDVPVIVFKAKIIPSRSENHWANGWTDYSKNVVVVPVKGDHFTLFEEPFVDDVGEKLKHLLNRSNH
ncbi:non-ribosomal peptide synthetase [Echinicola rosea]|uniref:Carrier domain-containing protein n=1 Tax=Echinicola rosea TaxID=1807691 RepID=A0ABQ1V0E5_9BACT|nr:amino acid adenylation domain-containing protein [Echinicola rosea]GGF33113.1 hypothetical protein GCM10011339_21600 [Echinicola rosea]